MKKFYSKPSFEEELIEVKDVITTSGEEAGDGEFGSDDVIITK